MISKYKYKGLLWVDLHSPRKEEVASIVEEFDLGDDIKLKIEEKSTESEVYVDIQCTYLVLNFPQITIKKPSAKDKKIGFLIGKNFLITVHKEPINTLEDFAKQFENEEILNGNTTIDNSASLFYYLIEVLNKETSNQLQKINSLIINTRKTKVAILCIIVVLLIISNLYFIYFK